VHLEDPIHPQLMSALFVIACFTCVFAWAENSAAAGDIHRITANVPERPALNDQEILRLAMDLIRRQRQHADRPVPPPPAPALRRGQNHRNSCLDRIAIIIIVLFFYVIVVPTTTFLRLMHRR
jgi:hypothetical protein